LAKNSRKALLTRSQSAFCVFANLKCIENSCCIEENSCKELKNIVYFEKQIKGGLMLKAYKKFWEGYADFTGYSTVSEYWWPHFIHLIITMPLFYALIQLQIDPNDVSAYQLIFSLRPLYSVFGLIIFLPSLTLSVRRLRDAGLHWLYLLVALIPYVGWLFMLLFMILPTNRDEEVEPD